MQTPLQTRMVLFVCPHGAAKSVVAAALFREAVRVRGLDFEAGTAGLDPDPEVPAAVRDGLRRVGLDAPTAPPMRLDDSHLRSAARIVTIECEIDSAPAAAPIEQWRGVPAVSDGFDAALADLRSRVDDLVSRLERQRAPT